MSQAAAQRAIEPRHQNGATVDRHDLMRAQRRKADFEHVVGAAPGVKHRAPAALAMRFDQIIDVGA